MTYRIVDILHNFKTYFRYLDKKSAQYKTLHHKKCRIGRKLGKFTDLTSATSTCTGEKACTGIISKGCKDEKFRLCTSSELKDTERGHCVRKKNLGKTSITILSWAT